MSYSVSGIAFSAMSTNYLNIDYQNNTKIEDKLYSYKTLNISDTLVEFHDPLNAKIVSISLNDNVLNRLKNHFSSQDFDKNEDGNIMLSGKAEKFLSGWFGDIAYKREFLNADTNHDTILDTDEYLKTKNDFYVKGEFYDKTNIKESIHSSYIELSSKESFNYIRNHVKEIRIDDELNRTIYADKNFDSMMTLDEAYGTMNGSKSILLSHAKEFGLFDELKVEKNMFTDIIKNKSKKLVLKKEYNNEDDVKKQHTLLKLLQVDGDVSKLTVSERKILGSGLLGYLKNKVEELNNSLSIALDSKIQIDIQIYQGDNTNKERKLQILEKLQETSLDTSILSNDEKEFIASELTKITEEGQIDTNKLESIIKNIKATQVYKESPEIIGKYYEDKG